MRATIIIPAHNEEAVITRCLDGIHSGSEPAEWEIIVAANGCSDRTVEHARAHPSRPICLDLPAPGKPAALNAADAVASKFPRIYLDADIEVSSQTLREIVTTLEDPEALVAAPRAVFRTQGCSALVRSYYRIWRELPVLSDTHVGSGLFALSREGHARVAPFPTVVAEDEYVRRSFLPAERRRSSGTFDVRVARTVRSLVRRGTRTRAGNRQLDVVVSVQAVERLSTGRYVLQRARSLRELPHVVVFVAITLAVRLLSFMKLRRGDMRWERDDSSRTHDAQAALLNSSTPGVSPDERDRL
jgi:glycosyltransferase involved in cell wall biosynthesis